MVQNMEPTTIVVPSTVCDDNKDHLTTNYSNVDLNRAFRESMKKKFKEIESPFVENERPKRFSPLLRQILVSSGPIAVTIASGMTSGFSAILLPQLKTDASNIPITDDQASWIASMAAFPMAFGCILGGVLMERFGRKATHIITCVPYLIGWLTICFATNITMILTGRFLTGLCVGLLGPPSCVYIGETSEPKYRGFLLAAVSLAIAVGLFAAHLLGTFFTWQTTAGVSAALPVACVVLLTFVPESPSWLLNKGRLGEAEKAFAWCRGHGREATDEMKAMFEKQTSCALAAHDDDLWTKAKRPEFVKPLLIMMTFFVVTQFSGVNAVAFYSVSIMKETVGEGLDEYLAMMAVDTMRVVMSVAACLLTRKYGRRPLVIISGFGTAFCLLGLSAFMYLAKNNAALSEQSWIPLLALLGYITFVSVGLVPLPWAMTGEVFPLAIRGVGSAITSSTNFVAFFAVVKTGPALFGSYGPAGAFLGYGTVATLGTSILYVFLPETKDKTLQEIEEHFVGGKTVRSNDVV